MTTSESEFSEEIEPASFRANCFLFRASPAPFSEPGATSYPCIRTYTIYTADPWRYRLSGIILSSLASSLGFPTLRRVANLRHSRCIPSCISCRKTLL
jgi:hypothetical protein